LHQYFPFLKYEWSCDVNVARVINSIFSKWKISANQTQWNITGDVCSGGATDSSITIDDYTYNPFIKCDCSFNKNTTCRIIALYSLSLSRSLSPFLFVSIQLLLCLSFLSLCNAISLECNRKVYALDVIGEIPPELWTLTYLTNLYVFFHIFLQLTILQFYVEWRLVDSHFGLIKSTLKYISKYELSDLHPTD